MPITVTRHGTVSVTMPPRPRVGASQARYGVGVTLAQGAAAGEPYIGSYEVTPSTSEQVLATRRKTMGNDVTVHSIPYVETTNEQGGYTISIAS